MAGPLSGVAAQQIPVSQPSQQDQNNVQVRQREERDPEDGRVQPQGAAAAESQGSEASNQNDLQRQADELLAAHQGDNGQQSATLRRGSLVDIVT